MKSQRPPPRLLLREPIDPRRQLRLPADQASYLNRVLRLRAKSAVIVFDGRGEEHLARIVQYTKGGAEVELLEALPVMPNAGLRVLLMQGISKADRMDFAIQKATELGVAEILPVYTQYSVVRLDKARALRRLAHWQRVAGSACEQSGRHYPPLVHPPENLSPCITGLPAHAPRLAFHPDGERRLGDLPGAPETVVALIGPEGGFSPRELELLHQAKFQTIRLGHPILRTETAALVACALLQARWGDLMGPGSAVS